MDAVPSMLEYIVRGAASAVLPMNLLVMFIGLVVGIVGGMLPGITTVTAVALFVPFTFSMPPDMALIGLGGVFCGAMYGGANAAIVPSGGVSGSISKMKILAVFAPERSKRFPGAPTMKEVGYDINSAVGRYIAAPKGVPAEKRTILEDTFKTILSNPEVIARYENAGTVVAWKSGEELRKMFEEYEKEGRAMVEFYQKTQSK